MKLLYEQITNRHITENNTSSAWLTAKISKNINIKEMRKHQFILTNKIGATEPNLDANHKAMEQPDKAGPHLPVTDGYEDFITGPNDTSV